MIKDKNILKGNKFADLKVVSEHGFYAVVEVKVERIVEGKKVQVPKSIVLDYVGSRIVAKQELLKEARQLGGKIIYFGAFKN